MNVKWCTKLASVKSSRTDFQSSTALQVLHLLTQLEHTLSQTLYSLARMCVNLHGVHNGQDTEWFWKCILHAQLVLTQPFTKVLERPTCSVNESTSRTFYVIYTMLHALLQMTTCVLFCDKNTSAEKVFTEFTFILPFVYEKDLTSANFVG